MEIVLSVAVFSYTVGYLIGKAKARYSENIGEQLVNKILNKHFAKEEYHLLKNVTLPISGGTTQIDHVLVSTKGVFVIETKHYSGWIFGSPKQQKWTQTIFKVKNKFQNPIYQNYKHIKELNRYFDFVPERSFKSIIVFTGDAKFKTQMPENVLYSDNLVSHINKFDEEIISLNRVFFIIGKLEFFRKEISYKTDKEHVDYLRKKLGKI